MNLKIISAGAGSGKTYRLTEEMVTLLKPDNPLRVRASGIIATTFTKKAAAELQERVRTKLIENGLVQEADDLSNALIGTVHALGVKLLKRFAFEAGVSPEVDIIADEDQQVMFNQALAAILLPETMQKMDILSQRLGLNKKANSDWRREVKFLTDVARSNAMTLPTLAQSKQWSVERFFDFLQPVQENLSEQAFDQRLKNLIESTLAALRQNDDTTKTTQNVVKDLASFQHKFNVKEELEWHEWAKIHKNINSIGKKSRPDYEELSELAGKVEQHPRFRADVKDFVEAIFDISMAALEEYDRYKKRRGLIDYIDMEISVQQLLNKPDVQAVLREELDLLLVDEFQDTSPIQLEIFWKLSQFAQYSIWVGDPKQSIYGFRGADPELMQAIIEATGGIKEADIQPNSWRSRQDLVYAANALFTRAFPKLPTEQIALEPVRMKAKDAFDMDNALKYWHFKPDEGTKRTPGSPWMENCIAHSIKKALLEKEIIVQPRNGGQPRPVTAGDIAVLCRTNKEAQAIAEALHRAGLKAAIARSGLLQTAEVRLILACLRFILNRSDSLSVAEILLLASEKNIVEIIENRLDFLQNTTAHWSDWAKENGYIQQLHDLRRTTAELSGNEILDLTLETLDLRRIIVRWGNPEQRFANVDALRHLAAQYEENCTRLHTAASLGGFLLWLNDLNARNLDHQGSGEGSDAVNVLTYHKSKGLEWAVVVCYALEAPLQDRIWGVQIVSENSKIDLNNILGNRWLRYWINPYSDQSAMMPLSEKIDASSIKKAATTQALEEDARLLYVGLTRARDYLVLAARHGKDTKWLNRTWHNGNENLPTFDPLLSANLEAGTYESPWFWKNQNIPVDTEILVYEKDFKQTEPPPPTIFYWNEQAGVQPFPYFFYDTDKEDLKDEFDWHYKKEIKYSLPISLNEEAEKYTVAKVLKAFLCADNLDYPQAVRLNMAQTLLLHFQAADMTEAEHVLRLSEDYTRYFQNKYTVQKVYRKFPVQLQHYDRHFQTIVDLIVQTEEGIVLVQNSGFAGGRRDWRKKVQELASWLYLTRKAVLKLFGDPPQCVLLLNFVMEGCMVMVEIKHKPHQRALF